MKEEIIMNGDVSLFVRSHGAGFPIIFLHGFPETADSWNEVIRLLPEKEYKLIAFDLRGFGRSGKPLHRRDYRMDIFVSDTAAVIKYFGGKAILVGHDWGGIIAWEAAHTHPDFVSKLVILNAPHTSYFPKMLQSSEQIIKSWYVFFFQISFIPEYLWKCFGKKILRRMFERDLGVSEKTEKIIDDNYVFLKDSIHYPLMYYRSLAGFLCRKNKKYSALPFPVRVLWGNKDRYLSLSFSKPPEHLVPLAQTIYFDASHWLHHEKSNDVAREIETFLKI